MNKAMLIMDMPECCEKCMFARIMGEEVYCTGFPNNISKKISSVESIILNNKPNWCPLREIPKKVDFVNEYQDDANLYSDDFAIGYSKGFNACINGMLGN